MTGRPLSPARGPVSRLQVFDITHHVLTHPGWTSGCATSQLLAILRTLGTDCTEGGRVAAGPGSCAH